MNGWDSLRERLDGLLPEGSLRARFARGAFWSIAGVAIARILALAGSVLVARIFNNRELYGQLGMVRNTVEMFGVFAGLGLGLTAAKHVAEFRRGDPARAGRLLSLAFMVAMITGAAVAVAVFLFAPWIAERRLNAPQLAPELRIGCLIFLFETLNGVQIGALSGFEAFKTVAGLSFVRGLLTFPILIAGAWFWGLPGTVGALAMAAATGWLINRIALTRVMRREGVPPASLSEARRELPVLWNFSIPAFLTTALASYAAWESGALFVRKIGEKDGYAGLGLFSAASQWQYPIVLLSAQMSVVLLPLLASLGTGRGDERRSERTVQAAYLVVVVVVAPMVAALASLAGPIMGLYGPQYAGAAGVFCAAIFVAGAKSVGMIPGTLLQSRGAMWTTFLITAAEATVLIAVVWVRADDAQSYANAFSLSYLTGAVAGLACCGVARFCPWPLVLRLGAIMACLGVFSYGMGLFHHVAWKAAIIVGAAALALMSGLSAWRRYRRPARPAVTETS